MKIIAVEPNEEELIFLSESIRKIYPPGTSVECFRDALFAYQYACLNSFEALYATAEMKHMNGFEMIRLLRGKYPNMQAYILWNDEGFRLDAGGIGADGYIIKPATPEKISEAYVKAEEDEFCTDQLNNISR